MATILAAIAVVVSLVALAVAVRARPVIREIGPELAGVESLKRRVTDIERQRTDPTPDAISRRMMADDAGDPAPSIWGEMADVQARLSALERGRRPNKARQIIDGERPKP